jgi:hypothetical protein
MRMYSSQNYQNGTVSTQVTDVGRGNESVLGVTVNLLICDRRGALYSVVYTSHSLILFLCNHHHIEK